jgi:hypothetical protein
LGLGEASFTGHLLGRKKQVPWLSLMQEMKVFDLIKLLALSKCSGDSSRVPKKLAQLTGTTNPGVEASLGLEKKLAHGPGVFMNPDCRLGN